MKALLVVFSLSACAPVADPFKQATALIEPRSGSTAHGLAEFNTAEGGGVYLRVRIADAPPGVHGLHLHQLADCSSADAKSAGDHWNPDGHEHGMPGEQAHAGDLGNITIGGDGRGELEITSSRWSILGELANDVVGHAVILHGGVDQFTQPNGMAGDRIGCGEIRWGEMAAATAILEPRSGSTVRGLATFVRNPGARGVTLKLTVSGATPGVHGAHVHQNGDCSSADGMSAGGHWNPAGEAHGQMGSGLHHGGDIGNLVVGAEGTGTLELTSEEWALRTGTADDVVGHALIVHAAPDDFTSQPAGNAGMRVACGVVVTP